MPSRPPITHTTPVCRIVYGAVHKAQLQTEDDNRTPKKIKSGQNAGKDLYMYVLGVAIQKTPGRDWKDEPWGKAISDEALACWPGGQTQQAGFAFKVGDGDSTTPNGNMKRPCDMPGRAGHWILNFAGINAPALWNGVSDTYEATQDSTIMLPGDLVQVHFDIKSNESTKKAGMYLGPLSVCWRGYDKVNGRIQTQQVVNPNVFGATGVATGGSAMPASMPGTAPTPPAAAPAPVPPAAAPVPPAAAPAPTAVTPDPSFIPTPPAAAPTPRMAHKDGNSWPVANMTGWTEATLLQQGFTITGG